MEQHAFVIEAGKEEGVEFALGFAERELGLVPKGNPDVVVLLHGLFSVEHARKVAELASVSPFGGTKRALIIAADRAYHEAQNALLKVFEEPAPGVHVFLILPSLGGLLPTLRSRVHILHPKIGHAMSDFGVEGETLADTFIRGSKEKRGALIKQLTSGKDEDARRENREEAIALINDIERALYVNKHPNVGPPRSYIGVFEDIATLRGYLYDRSAPVKMILEHLALVMPHNVR